MRAAQDEPHSARPSAYHDGTDLEIGQAAGRGGSWVCNRVVAQKKRWPFHICKNAPHGTLAALFWVRKGGTGHSPAAARSMARGTGAQCDRQLWRRLAGRSSWLLTSSDSAAGGLLQLGKLPASRAASLQRNDAARAEMASWARIAAGAVGSLPGWPQIG